MADLVQIVPGMQVSSNKGKEGVNITIRGIGMANQFSSNSASPVGIYSDGVYQGFLPSRGIQQFDLDRVEVLRGAPGNAFWAKHNGRLGQLR